MKYQINKTNNNYYMKPDGSWISGSGTYYYSDPIEVHAGETYVIIGSGAGSSTSARMRIAIYDGTIIGSATVIQSVCSNESPIVKMSYNPMAIFTVANDGYLYVYGGEYSALTVDVQLVEVETSSDGFVWQNINNSAIDLSVSFEHNFNGVPLRIDDVVYGTSIKYCRISSSVGGSSGNRTYDKRFYNLANTNYQTVFYHKPSDPTISSKVYSPFRLIKSDTKFAYADEIPTVKISGKYALKQSLPALLNYNIVDSFCGVSFHLLYGTTTAECDGFCLKSTITAYSSRFPQNLIFNLTGNAIADSTNIQGLEYTSETALPVITNSFIIDFGNVEQYIPLNWYLYLISIASKTAYQKSYDLSVSSEWQTLSDGDHVVTIKARSAAYKDSESSAGVTVTKVLAVTLINFTINNTSYQAESGMTWEEWINSSYNTTGGLSINGDYIVNGSTEVLSDGTTYEHVTKATVIIESRNYYLSGGNEQ